MTEYEIKKQLIAEVEEFIEEKYKISSKKQLIDILLTILKEGSISKRQLQRYFIKGEISDYQKATADNFSQVIGFENFDLYKTSLKLGREGILVQIPRALVVIPQSKKEEIIGREKEKEELDRLLKINEKVVLVNGIGGIGKTTLAKYYLNEFKNQYHHVAWIEVYSSIKEAFVSKTDLIDSLGIEKQIYRLKNDEGFIDKAFKLIINRMRSLKPLPQTPNNLLVIDNASEEIEQLDILDYISLQPYWKVLVTSRSNLEGFVSYEIDTLSQEDAVTMFYLNYKIEKDDNLVLEILKLIDFHTLGIELISKTAQSLRLEIKEMLNTLKKKGIDLSFNTNIKIKHNKNKKLQHIKNYLDIVFDIAEISDYQQWILTQFIALPSKYIQYKNKEGNSLIDFLKLEGSGKNRFTRELNGIVKSGWLTWDENKDAFKLHKLIQEVLEIKLTPNILKCKNLIDSLNSKLSYQNLDVTAFLYANHIDNVITGNLDLNYANFLDNLSASSIRVEMNDKAISYQKKALNTRKNNQASKEELSESYNGLALSFLKLGNYKKALEYQLKDKYIMLSGQYEDSYELAVTYNNLSLIYRNLDDNFKEAYLYQRKAMKIGEKIDDKDFNCIIYNNMGNLLFLKKKYKESIAHFQKSLEYRKEYSDSIFIAEGKMNLAVAILETTDFHESKNLLEEAIEVYKEFELLFDQCRIHIHLARYFKKLNNDSSKPKLKFHLNAFDNILLKIDKKSINKKDLKKIIQWRREIN